MPSLRGLAASFSSLADLDFSYSALSLGLITFAPLELFPPFKRSGQRILSNVGHQFLTIPRFAVSNNETACRRTGAQRNLTRFFWLRGATVSQVIRLDRAMRCTKWENLLFPRERSVSVSEMRQTPVPSSRLVQHAGFSETRSG